jgi:hypothetical protein
MWCNYFAFVENTVNLGSNLRLKVRLIYSFKNQLFTSRFFLIISLIYYLLCKNLFSYLDSGNIFIFHPENTMYNVSAEGTFEKREIKKIVTTETYDDN